MAKITRYDGNLVAFGSGALGTERTVFGDVTQSDALDDNINLDFIRGWGIVGVNENPTKQDFNAVAYTATQLLAYLHQMGLPEWNTAQEYHAGSCVIRSGATYISVIDNNTGNDPVTDDGTNWAEKGISYINGIDKLRSIAPTTNRMIYRKFHTTSLDDGGGKFIGVTGEAPGTFIDNDGTIVVPTGGDGSAAWLYVGNNSGISVNLFGAVGDGVTDDTASIQSAFDYFSGLTSPVTVIFSAGKNYLISSQIDCGLPERSVISAYGSAFTCTHNGVAFDINPAATAVIPKTDTLDDVTLRGIRWKGGKFSNSNVTKTASVAIQAYFMRGFYVTDVYVENFYSAFKFGAKDTYAFKNCYTYSNVRHYWVPDAGVLFTEAAGFSGNDLLGVTLSECHLSVQGDEAGIYCENRVINFRVENTSFNGAATVAQVRFTDTNYLYSRTISFSNVHFEQIGAATPAVLFDSSNGFGHYNISFDNACEFISGTVGWHGVTLGKCNYVTFGAVEFSDGSGGATEQGVYVDDDSRHIVIEEGTHFLSFAAGQQIVLQSAANRANVSIQPNFIPDSVALVGYNGVTKSTGNETIDMSTAYSGFADLLLPPKAYAISTRARDSASAGTSTSLSVLKNAVVSTDSGVVTNLTGAPNDTNRHAAGIVQADENGDVYLSYTASGVDTLTIVVAINGVHQ